MTKPDVSIIIVNYNTQALTTQCVNSIFASKTSYAYEVILVDNASTDGSIRHFESYKHPLKIIKNTKNLGFAKANNQAAQVASGKYLFILNSDTILKPNTIQILLEETIKSKKYLATCQLKNVDGSNQNQGGALPNLVNITTWMLNLDSMPFIAKLIPPYQAPPNSNFYLPTSSLRSAWIAGTALLIRRDLFATLRGFDAHMFMYGEDIELCLRAAKGQFYPHYTTKTSLVHLGQGSGTSENALLGEIKGLRYIFTKHFTPIQTLYLRFILKVGLLLRVISFAILGDTIKRKIYEKAIALA